MTKTDNIKPYFSEVSHVTYEQRSDEWYRTRLGVPTASMFRDLRRRKAAQNRTRSTYMGKLIAEKITKTRTKVKATPAMQRGIDLEPAIREHWSRRNSTMVRGCGVYMGVTTTPKGHTARVCASPDGLIDDHGLLEIKTTNPHNMINLYQDTKAKIADYYIDQIQGQMLLTGRTYCHLVVFADDHLPMLDVKIERDEEYIAMLHKEVLDFWDDMHDVLNKIASEVYDHKRHQPTHIETGGSTMEKGGIRELIRDYFPDSTGPVAYVPNDWSDGPGVPPG